MKIIRYWIKAARLRTLPLSVSGVLLGSALSAEEWWTIPLFWWAILTTVGFQVLSNFANDLGDGVRGTDQQRLGEARMVASGRITARQMKCAVWISALLSFLSASVVIFLAFGQKNFFLSFLFFNLTLMAIWAAVRYTVGVKAYGYSGWGDLFVFLFFGLLAVLGSSTLFIKQINSVLLFPAMTIGLFSVAVLNLNNMRDAEQDLISGKRTLAVKLGFERAKRYHIILILVGVFCALAYGVVEAAFALDWLFVLAFIPLMLHLNRVRQISALDEFDAELKKVALSTFFYAIIMALTF